MFITKDGRRLSVIELSWDDVASKIDKVNPELVRIMKFVDGRSEYKFYQASYCFGDKIVDDGRFYLPLDAGGSIALDDQMLPTQLANELCYDKNTEEPLGLILNKPAEFYLFSKSKIQPYAILQPGQMFGIPKAVDDISGTSTSVLELGCNAGARSLFMLAQISDKRYHSKLQEHYGIKTSAPNSPEEHWNIFVEIAAKANSSWRCEVIYFSRKWIKQLKSYEWSVIAKHLMIMHRASYSIKHKVAGFWDKTFQEVEHEKQLTKNYTAQSLIISKQLFMFASGAALGFRPAVNDYFAPISLFVKAYSEVYNKYAQPKYSPIIMEPAQFNSQTNHPIYYSSNHSAFIFNNLEASGKKSQIALLEEIRVLNGIYINSILATRRSRNSSLYDLAQSMQVSYYHSNPENYRQIQDSQVLVTEDARFATPSDSAFPKNSPFFKGCIKITCKN